MCLGYEPFEEKHTGELLSKWVDSVTEDWMILHKVDGVVSDTVANMKAMMVFLINLSWIGCTHHVLQLVINVR